jgi:UDP-N-acetylmuramate-alanine ligase
MSAVSLPLPSLFGRTPCAVHALGVSGMGMGPLAIYLAGLGFRVSGGDDSPAPAMMAQLDRAGVSLNASNEIPAGTELVVTSSALAPSHPALVSARARGLPVVRRGELLAELARTRRLIALCGSHGKTTTTAMLIAALQAAGVDAGYVGGGLFADDSIPPAAAGSSDWLVAEIDESDGTIAAFSPALTVVVNLDWDHPDHYRTQAAFEDAFAALFARTTGPILINAGCALSARIAAGPKNVLSFGLRGDYGLISQIASGPLRLALTLGGRFPIAAAQVRAFGEFNALNATAALAAARRRHAAGPRFCLRSLPDQAGPAQDVPRRPSRTAGRGAGPLRPVEHWPAHCPDHGQADARLGILDDDSNRRDRIGPHHARSAARHQSQALVAEPTFIQTARSDFPWGFSTT